MVEFKSDLLKIQAQKCAKVSHLNWVWIESHHLGKKNSVRFHLQKCKWNSNIHTSTTSTFECLLLPLWEEKLEYWFSSNKFIISEGIVLFRPTNVMRIFTSSRGSSVTSGGNHTIIIRTCQTYNLIDFYKIDSYHALTDVTEYTLNFWNKSMWRWWRCHAIGHFASS